MLPEETWKYAHKKMQEKWSLILKSPKTEKIVDFTGNKTKY